MNSSYHQMQHFISDSNWDARAVIDHAAKQTNQALPRQKLTGLIIDETGVVKKGNSSVGVARQYCGNVGKTDNCQVSVMACLSNGDHAAMVDARLYLPKSWCNDKERCEKVGIPENERVFKTKTQMAVEMIRHQHELGVAFDFASADAFYGKDPNVADSINDMGKTYMLDIHEDQHIHLTLPELKTRGKSIKPSTPGKRVDQYVKTLNESDWQELKIRNTAKGAIKAKYHFCPVYVWNNKRQSMQSRLLVVRRLKTKNTTEIRYSFTNASLEDYHKKDLAYMQAQRFFVEHTIKECKQILGLSHFQTRKWRAWQHQVAINIMTSGFLLTEKLYCHDDLPLLSAADIKEWITYKLYKQLTDEEMIERIFQRHKKRQYDINIHYRNGPN